MVSDERGVQWLLVSWKCGEPHKFSTSVRIGLAGIQNGRDSYLRRLMGENSNKNRHILGLSLSTTMASQWRAAVAIAALIATLGAFPAYCFSLSCPLSRGNRPSRPCSLQAVQDPSSPADGSTHNRRSWLQTSTSLVAATVLLPAPALAGIDVSGLQQQSGATSNSVIRDQLRAYDGSASTRLQQAKELSSTTGSSLTSRNNSIGLIQHPTYLVGLSVYTQQCPESKGRCAVDAVPRFAAR